MKVFGKGSRERECFITEHCMKVLERWLEIRKTRVWKKNPALFINIDGTRRILDFYIQLHIERYGKQAGISHKMSQHQLRHSDATHLLNKGMDIRRVQYVLGHVSIQSTIIYTHIIDDKQIRELMKFHSDYSSGDLIPAF